LALGQNLLFLGCFWPFFREFGRFWPIFCIFSQFLAIFWPKPGNYALGGAGPDKWIIGKTANKKRFTLDLRPAGLLLGCRA